MTRATRFGTNRGPGPRVGPAPQARNLRFCGPRFGLAPRSCFWTAQRFHPQWVEPLRWTGSGPAPQAQNCDHALINVQCFSMTPKSRCNQALNSNLHTAGSSHRKRVRPNWKKGVCRATIMINPNRTARWQGLMRRVMSQDWGRWQGFTDEVSALTESTPTKYTNQWSWLKAHAFWNTSL